MSKLPAVQRVLQEARPLVRRALSHRQWQIESVKGCSALVHSQPVSLTPPLHPIPRPDLMPLPSSAELTVPLVTGGGAGGGPERDPASLQAQPQVFGGERVWFGMSVHPDHPPGRRDHESFLRLLHGASHGFVFEAAGNQTGVRVRIGIHAEDHAALAIAAAALHIGLGVGQRQNQRLPMFQPRVIEFVPRPPYADAFTGPGELPQLPVGLIVGSLVGLPETYHGLYQVCAEPVSDDRWGHNARSLHDLRFRTLLEPAGPEGLPSAAWTQQVPSGSLHQLTQDTFTKTHPDRALFFALSRVALWPPQPQPPEVPSPDADAEVATFHLQQLAAPMRLIRQGGRPLDHLPPEVLALAVGDDGLSPMLAAAHVHRHGILLNSEELAGWVHLPPLEVIERFELDTLRREPLIPKRKVGSGTRVGVCIDGADRYEVAIPPPLRSRHTTVIGCNGVGKSTMITSMVLDDIQRGDGMLMLDPHGTMVRNLADLLPPDAAARTWWLDFEDPEYALLFNPLRAGGDERFPSRVADHFIGAFKAMSEGWGHRLEHIMRNLLTAVMQLPNGSILDAYFALEKNTELGKDGRRRLKNHSSDPLVQRFLGTLDKTYNNADLNPAYHKLSILLQSGPGSLSMRQPENRLNVPSWMRQGDIILVDLSQVSGEFKHMLGSLLIAAVYTAALGRKSERGGSLRPFHLVVDEAHRFSPFLQSKLISETRKFEVGLTLAHQYLKQFPDETVRALGTARTSIIFNVDHGDAKTLSHSLQGKVSADQIVALHDFEAFVRLGTEVVRVHTPAPIKSSPGSTQFEQIRARSIEQWYAPRRVIEARVNEYLRGSGSGLAPTGSWDSDTPPVMEPPDDPDWP